MANSDASDNSLAKPIKLICWAGIAAYIILKIVGLSRGASLTEIFNLGDPSLAGLGVGACIVGLILLSPKMRRSAMLIEENETRTATLSFLFVFILMAAYYMLRPVRDGMASDWSDSEISQLWTIQFFLSAAIVVVYGFACSRIKFKYLVPGVYSFYAVTFVLFYIGSSLAIDFTVAIPRPFGWSLPFLPETLVIDNVFLDKSFYVWVSLFSLFHLSVFWSFMADLFNKEQSKRVFAFIAAGASAGAAAGPLVVAVIARDVGNETLMLIAAGILFAAIPLIFYLQRLKISDLHNEDVHADLSAAKMGGRWWAGFGDFFTSPYLLTIGVFIFLYTAISAWIYFEINDVLRIYEERELRTTILASRDAIVNLLTFGLGLFVTGRLVTRFGMPLTLALLPVIAAAGLLVIAFAPILTVMLAVDISRRAGNYGVTRPAREMLFTSIDREARFKSKPVVDVVVYRGGDAFWAWLIAILTDGLGLGYAILAAIGAGIAAIWAASGIYLGRVFNRREARTGADEDARDRQAKTAT
jgi:AAA family ATP:ADP antiporter